MLDLEEFIENPSVGALVPLPKSQWARLATHFQLEVRASFNKAHLQNIVLEHLVDENIFSQEEVEEAFPAFIGDTEGAKLSIERDRIRLELLREQNRAREMSRDDKAEKYVPPFCEKDPEDFFSQFEKNASIHQWPLHRWAPLLSNVFTGAARQAYTALTAEESRDYSTIKSTVLRAYERVPSHYRKIFRSTLKQPNQTCVEFFREKMAQAKRWVDSEGVGGSYKKLLELFVYEEVKSSMPPQLQSYLEGLGKHDLESAGPASDHYLILNPNVHFSRKVPLSQSALQPNSTVMGSRESASTSHLSGRPRFTPSASGESANRDVRTAGSTSNKLPTNQLGCTYCKKPNHTLATCFLVSRCAYCKQTGHLKDKCPKRGKYNASPALLVSKTNNPLVEPVSPSGDIPALGKVHNFQNICNNVPSDVHEYYKPYCFSGSVSLHGDSQPSIPITLLRDSGALHNFVLRKVVPPLSQCQVGGSLRVKGLFSQGEVPLCRIYLQSPVVSGYITAGIVDEIPVDGVSLVLGNVTVENMPGQTAPSTNHGNPPDPMPPKVSPVCVVTRSASRRMASNAPSEPHPSKTTIGNTVGHDTLSPEFSLQDFFQQAGKEPDPPESSLNSDPVVHCIEGTPVTRSTLIAEQARDPQLKVCFDHVVDPSERDHLPRCFYLEGGVLMRKFRPADVPADHDWRVIHQVVIPSSLQGDILKLAHDGVGGHLGVRKTHHKISMHFYWPYQKKSVAEYCKSCRICQVSGKPCPTINPAPLHPIPAVGDPFTHIIIDCVGPLPKSARGNAFLLTIMDRATRYPEAIPLRRITAKLVIQALSRFFTQVGLPLSVQSDQGTNFTSGLFKQVMATLGVRQYRSTAYHPESQGAVERFHQTLKTMCRSFVLETGKDWDEGIHLLLFAIRDSVQESLGFTPFQLVYGHEVRGPLKALKECFLDESAAMPLAAYVKRFRERMCIAQRVASENLQGAQVKMKAHYDQTHKVQSREFHPGDQVLVFLPLHLSPFQSRFCGPYKVIKKINEVNYVISTPERRKKTRLVHINLIKPFHTRSDTENNAPRESQCLLVSSGHEESVDAVVDPVLRNSEVLQNPGEKLAHLPSEQAAEVLRLLQEHPTLFHDNPSLCPLLCHDVDVKGAPPIRQPPYRLNAEKREVLRQEVQRLLEQGLIEPSLSPWASPVVMVPKSNGKVRMCVDYRKVNAVTVPDSFPLPRMDDIIDDLGQARYVSKFDLLQGYYQLGLTERASQISAFITPEGLYHFKVLPFGMRNAPSSFQRLMNHVVMGLSGVRCYLDDLVVFSDDWGQHLQRLRDLFQRLTAANLTINLTKSEFGHAQVTFLGHVVGQGRVLPVNAKIEAITQYPVPDNKKALMRFLGMATYYRRFCPNFSTVATPLTDMLSSKRVFAWTPDCQHAFATLKALLTDTPVLRAPDLQKPFVLQVDASDLGTGAVLLQEGEDSILHPIGYYSHKLKSYQRSYATIEKEALALLMALEHFKVYIGQSRLLVLTDHNPLTFVERMKLKNSRLLRWSLTLQPYNIEIRHIRGKENLVADALSRAH